MNYNNQWITLFFVLLLSACQSPKQEKITFEDIKDSSNRALPTKIEDNITFYNAKDEIISTDKFNQLLAEGLYLSKQTLNIDGSEEVRLISIEEHAKNLSKNPVPNFKIEDLAGNSYTQESLKGKITILSFWFTASYPCTKEIQELNVMAKKYARNKDLLWLAPALDQSADLSRFLRGKNWNFKFIADQESLALQFGILTYPTHLVINKEGKIAATIIHHPNSRKAIAQAIQQLL